MDQMSAAVIREPGGPEVLEIQQRPLPRPGPGEIRVRVRAAGVNRADLLQRRGQYPAPPGWPVDIPGLEYAGQVDALGEGAGAWARGDRVMGLVGGGGYAEYVTVDEREAIRIPERLSFEEAAAVPEVFITAHDALFTQLELRDGERLLIHAVGSGVGTAGLQLAKAAGATVFGTSRTAWKLKRARELGLDVGIDTPEFDFADEVMRRTGHGGVDVILDLVGGDYFAGNLGSLAEKGRMAVVGLTAGSTTEIDLAVLLRRRLTVIGTSLRLRSQEEKISAARAFAEGAGELLASGRVRPIVDSAYPLEAVVEAHRRMEANANFGKLILDIAPC